MTAPDIPALLALNAHIWATAEPWHEDTTWADADPTAYDLPMTGTTHFRPGERRNLA